MFFQLYILLSILLFPIIKTGTVNGISPLKQFLGNNVNLVFFMIIDHLLPLTHWHFQF